MKDFFKNEIVIEVLVIIIMLSIIFGIIFISIKSDKSRCGKNGGIYIYEWSYGNKCHLKGD